MTLLLADVLLGLVVEYYDLLALTMLDYGALSGNALYYGLANYDLVAAKHQYFESNFSTYFGVQLFNEDLVASCYLVLLATGTDDSVHVLYLLLQISPICTAVGSAHTYKADTERLTESYYHVNLSMSTEKSPEYKIFLLFYDQLFTIAFKVYIAVLGKVVFHSCVLQRFKCFHLFRIFV